MNNNDIYQHRKTAPDAHGQAALLLVESLIHALIDHQTLSVREAMDALCIAIDARAEIALDADESRESSAKSLMLLNAIRQTLMIDLPASA